MRNLSKAYDIIKKYEGLYLKSYADPVGIPTIGWGTTVYPGGVKVKLGQTISTAQAQQFLEHDINEDCVKPIDKLVKVSLNDNQYCALVSFVYNVGQGAFASSTMLKMINAGDFSGAAGQFPRWNKASGIVLNGLTKRRLEEQALFVEPESVFVEAENDEKEPSWLEPIKALLDKILDLLKGKTEEIPTKSIRDLILEKNPIISPRALDGALKYVNHDSIKNKNYITVVDFDKNDYDFRGHVINMNTGETIVSGPVAHGSGSGAGAVPVKFSNVSGSYCSSLGPMVFKESYVSSKKSSTSFRKSRRIVGLDKVLNSNVLARGIVLHDASYVSLLRASQKNIGNSQGCFVFDYTQLLRFFYLVEGSLLYAHHSSLE